MMNILGDNRKNASKFIKLEARMAQAPTYDEWLVLSQEHDSVNGAEDWRHNNKSELYDYININTRLSKLRNLRQNKDDHGLLFALNEGIHGNKAKTVQKT